MRGMKRWTRVVCEDDNWESECSLGGITLVSDVIHIR